MGRKTPQAWQNCGCWARFGCHGRDGRVIVGVDLDSCLDANGLPAEWAEDVIGRFGSYSEIRPSQNGAKIFALVAGADLPVISAVERRRPFSARARDNNSADLPREPADRISGTESLLTPRWREADSNFQFLD